MLIASSCSSTFCVFGAMESNWSSVWSVLCNCSSISLRSSLLMAYCPVCLSILSFKRRKHSWYEELFPIISVYSFHQEVKNIISSWWWWDFTLNQTILGFRHCFGFDCFVFCTASLAQSGSSSFSSSSAVSSGRLSVPISFDFFTKGYPCEMAFGIPRNS